MKRTFFFSLITFALAVPALALAQAADAVAAPAFADLIQQALGTVSTWKTAGWLAGSVALVNVLINVLKFEPLANFLTGLKIGWWLRPVLSLVFGVVAGVLSSVVGGAPVGISVLVALLSGLGSTGFHELITIANQRVQAERGVGSAVVGALTAANPEAATTLQAKLAEIEKLSPEDRLAALAALGKKS